MKHLSYLLLITLYLHSAIHGMESLPLLKENTCTFITNETDPESKYFPIHLSIAQQCKTINAQIEDCKCTATTFSTDSSRENTLKFISYLKKIAIINELAAKKQSHLLTMHNDILTQHIQTFNDPELIELTRLVDYFEVADSAFKNNTLIEEISKRIAKTINNKEDATPFFHIFNGRPICRNIMQRLTKKDKIDSKLIQLYSDLLTQQLSLPRTEPRLESILTKIYNCCWSWNVYNWSWDTIRYKPRYMNTTTGTIIKTEEIVDEACNTTKTKSLKIFKKNSPPICIPLTDVDKITHITANADESLFICNLATMRIIDKRPTYNNSNYCLLINPNDTKNPVLVFNACAFTQKKNEVCVKINEHFGFLNLDAKKSVSITLTNGLEKNIIQITPINKKTTFALLTNQKQIIIGTSKNNENKNFSCYQLYIKKGTIKNIDHIHLCPNNNILYVAAYDKKHKPIFFIANLESQEFRFYNLPYKEFPDHAEFISDNILFLGYNKKKDHFFNLKTENSWTKQKSPLSIGRLALTTDFMSIEEIASDSDSEKKYHNRKITTKMIPVIDSTIIDSIKYLNGGYIPLSIYTIAKTESQLCNLPDNEIEQLNHQNEALKTLIAKTKTITSSDSPKTINAFYYLYHGAKQVCSTMIGYIKPVVTCILYIIGFIILSMMDKKTKLNEDTFKTLCNFHSFIDQVCWLIE